MPWGIRRSSTRSHVTAVGERGAESDKDKMIDNSSSFLLIPGAWMGGWAWDRVTRELVREGHVARTITLTGLDGSGDAKDIGIETHVEDVVSLLKSEDLSDIVLVGHSYSGIVATLAAARAPRRVAKVLHVASFLPRHGQALVDVFPASQAAAERSEIRDNGGWWLPPDEAGLALEEDLSDADRSLLLERFVEHPGRTVTEPVDFPGSLEAMSGGYLICTLEQGEDPSRPKAVANLPDWTISKIPAGHFPMLSMPEELAMSLVRLASQ